MIVDDNQAFQAMQWIAKCVSSQLTTMTVLILYCDRQPRIIYCAVWVSFSIDCEQQRRPSQSYKLCTAVHD